VKKYLLSLLLLAPISFMYAQESADSEEDVEEIVVTGIKQSLKDAIDIKRKNVGVANNFIGVPAVCRVSFMKGGAEHPVLPRFKMCAITQVDVNYTPDGSYATYRDGQPVAMGLTINFQETKLVFAEEIADDSIR